MAPKVAFLMANYGHDPTGNVAQRKADKKCSWINVETAVPYTEFRKAGFEVDFVTERGNMPDCDDKMLTGMTQKLLVGIMTYEDPKSIRLKMFLATGRHERRHRIVQQDERRDEINESPLLVRRRFYTGFLRSRLPARRS